LHAHRLAAAMALKNEFVIALPLVAICLYKSPANSARVHAPNRNNSALLAGAATVAWPRATSRQTGEHRKLFLGTPPTRPVERARTNSRASGSISGGAM
jgi:hypothetical protein